MRQVQSRQPAQGHTLLELLIVMGILNLFVAGTFQFVFILQAAQESQLRQLDQLQAVRPSLYEMLHDLRLIGYPASSNFVSTTSVLAPGMIAEGILEATATSFVFEADADGDGRVERIEYRMAADGTSLMRRASPKRLDGSLGIPTSDNQSFIQNLTNQTLADPLPVFSWDVDPDSSEPFPNNISIVYVSLAIEARLDPRDPSKKKIIHLAGASRRLNPSR